MKRTEISALGEFGLIQHLTKKFTNSNPGTLFGVGDDAAVIDLGGEEVMLVSTDMLVEGVHFDLIYTPLKHLGYKSVVVNLSDIYAMNGVPNQITVSLAISNRFSVEALEEFYEGVYAACKKYGVDLVGGDTTSSLKGFCISITAIGQVSRGRIAYRHNAQVGDLVCVTGDLGAAYLGLQLLEREKRIFLENPKIAPNLENKNYLVGRQLKPEPRADMIEVFEKADFVPTSMIDISDGLASELFHICSRSGVGVKIQESNIPIHPEATTMAVEFEIDTTLCALSGGEDYELLFTASPVDADKVKYFPNTYVIGEITEKEKGLILIGLGGKEFPLKAQGWKHF